MPRHRQPRRPLASIPGLLGTPEELAQADADRAAFDADREHYDACKRPATCRRCRERVEECFSCEGTGTRRLLDDDDEPFGEPVPCPDCRPADYDRTVREGTNA